jgi:hypothetical protein
VTLLFVLGKFISLPTVKQMDPFTSAIAARENRASKDGDGNSGGSNESLQHQQPRLKRRSTCAPTIIPAVFNEQALPVPVTRPFMPAIEYFEIGMLPESTGASNLTTMQQQ